MKHLKNGIEAALHRDTNENPMMANDRLNLLRFCEASRKGFFFDDMNALYCELSNCLQVQRMRQCHDCNLNLRMRQKISDQREARHPISGGNLRDFLCI